MQHKLLKYILDIESVSKEIDAIKNNAENDFNKFQSEIILILLLNKTV